MREPHVALGQRVKMALKALPHVHAKAKAGHPDKLREFKPDNGSSSAAHVNTNARNAIEKVNQERMPLDFLQSVIRALPGRILTESDEWWSLSRQRELRLHALASGAISAKSRPIHSVLTSGCLQKFFAELRNEFLGRGFGYSERPGQLPGANRHRVKHGWCPGEREPLERKPVPALPITPAHIVESTVSRSSVEFTACDIRRARGAPRLSDQARPCAGAVLACVLRLRREPGLESRQHGPLHGRNRHCPKCQGSQALAWMEERNAELLAVPYFHVVFTLPARIAAIGYQNKAVIYDLLFKACSQTMLTIAADPKRLGVKIGFTSVLHTWGSAMTHHPHVHMIVPGGGISLDGTRWIGCCPKYLLPVKVLSRLFRRLKLEMLLAAHDAEKMIAA